MYCFLNFKFSLTYLHVITFCGCYVESERVNQNLKIFNDTMTQDFKGFMMNNLPLKNS